MNTHYPAYLSTCFLILNFFILLTSGNLSAKQVLNTKNDSIKTVVIEGVVNPKQALTYKLEPFHVPEGIGRMEVQFEYTGQHKFAEMEIGVFDPDRFRGTSRFSKQSFFVGEVRATASYHPGPLISGTWNISLGFPTINKKSEYTVTIRLFPKTHSEFTGPSKMSIKNNSQWYRGDFHTHTGHSDAFGCEQMNGRRGPCQVYQVVEAAKRNGLDFVAITDHNTVSHHQDMAVIQPLFSDLMLIRGQEVTTFYGHANVFGTSMPIDFRVGFDGRTIQHIQQEVDALGALMSINHPGRQTGANCTGCGWSARSTDYNQLKVVEVVNGTNIENDIAGIPFWHKLLNEGYKVTGIGGSDDHAAGFGSTQPGTPTTMVYAHSLSEQAILAAVKKGNVYLKTRGADGPEITFSVAGNGKKWSMGDTIPIDSLGNQALEITLTYSHVSKQQLELLHNGEVIQPDIKKIEGNDGTVTYTGESKYLTKGWLRFNLRNAKDKGITIISNPIYLK